MFLCLQDLNLDPYVPVHWRALRLIWQVCKLNRPAQSWRSWFTRNGSLPPWLYVWISLVQWVDVEMVKPWGCLTISSCDCEGLRVEAGIFQPHTALFQDAQVTPSRAGFVPSILAAHPEPSPRSGTGIRTNKRKAAWARGYSYHRFWIILLFCRCYYIQIAKNESGEQSPFKSVAKGHSHNVMDSIKWSWERGRNWEGDLHHLPFFDPKAHSKPTLLYR